MAATALYAPLGAACGIVARQHRTAVVASLHVRRQYRAIGQQSRCRTVLVRGEAGEGQASTPAAAAGDGFPAAWELAQRVSGDAAAMIMTGEPFTAVIILEKGVAEIQHQHPGDPSAALLHTQLWNLQTEAGDHEEALKSAQAAYDLMLSHFGEQSADAAFHGIRLGISLIGTCGDMDRAQSLLMMGGATAQHNLQLFWNRLQELEAEGNPAAEELGMQTKKLMVALAECNFYGALAVVQQALQTGEDMALPIEELEGAWLGGMRQMAAALPPDHPMVGVAQRELARVTADAEEWPTLQEELQGVQTKLQELLYLLRQLPDSMQPQGSGTAAEGAAAASAAPSDDFLP
ncbi:hypothetical protein D9Q98_005960 [Chlorella vulgaris]|uniref:Uncharacterized protein n=1 Tax=Chlorella vulgaris TaxID=3077 RepID=A0A9D4Z0F3_CHLVU|nr:hypothetical protein D9Q98_005960 [Chlorella vulgaris]